MSLNQLYAAAVAANSGVSLAGSSNAPLTSPHGYPLLHPYSPAAAAYYHSYPGRF